MYTDEVRTPQALKTRYHARLSGIKCHTTSSHRRGNGNNNAEYGTTPTNGAKQQQTQTNCSPKMSIICTPPPKRFHRVRNPFEGALAERLHLPLIASPSLFQCRSRTPQLSSTQFEWDIEEVAQLKPADVEPHETQFHDSPDAEQESKAQLAISTFFKESHIVPSPVDCPLRNQRIILSEIDGQTPISNKSRRIRDCEVQTELSLPPVLPAALEEALRPYLQPHLANSFTSSLSSSKKPSDVFNNSMRRKLFDLHNVIVLNELEQDQDKLVRSSPQAKQTLFAGRLSDSASGGGGSATSFGSLSPIRNLCGLSAGTPDDGHAPGKRKLLHDLQLDLPSPIAPSEHLSQRLRSYREQLSGSGNMTLSELTGTGRAATCNFTPDRSSSPMQLLEYSTDSSINQRVSRMRVNSTRQMAMDAAAIEELGDELEEELEDAETDEEVEEELELEEVMQMSAHSFNCSSSNSDTPRGHRRRRSAQRKNLSQSFSTNSNWLDEDDEDEKQELEQLKQEQPVAQQQLERIELTGNSILKERIVLYRTDSGFNETSSTSTFALSQELPMGALDGVALDASMVCCSTPSTTRRS